MEIERIQSRLRSRRPRPIGLKHLFSVMLTLIEKDGELHILYQKRAASLRSQPNEISFPGGRIEPGETPADAARRETMEEIGVEIDKIKILSEMDYMVTRENTAIHCFVGYLEDVKLEDLKPNPDEVAYLFTVPLDFFLKNEPEGYFIEFKMKESEDFPYELIPGGRDYGFKDVQDTIYFYHYLDKIIWGFTAKMTYYFILTMKGLNTNM